MKRLLQWLLPLYVAYVYAQNPSSNFTLQAHPSLTSAIIPMTYTCDGKNISPALQWLHAPANTKAFVLTLTDPDAPGGVFYHWVLFNIPSTVTTLPENMSQTPGLRGKNSWGSLDYKGPCPPKGATHHYIFSIYALNKSLNLKEGADALNIVNAMQKNVIAHTSFTTQYGH